MTVLIERTPVEMHAAAPPSAHAIAGAAQLTPTAGTATGGAFRLLPVDPTRAAQAEGVYEALLRGEAPTASHRPFPGLVDNVPTITDVHHPAVGTIQAVVKPPAELAAQEAFAFDLARKLGIGHHYAQIAPRPDGTALIEIVAGTTWKHAGIKDIHDLDRAYSKAWLHHHPDMPPAERALRARVDRELVQFVDWLTAQSDRSPNNGLFDDRRVAVQLFDHGRLGFETPWNKLQPWLPYPYMGHDATGRVRTMHLSEEARSVIAANLGADDIRASHGRLLRRASREGMSLGQGSLLRYLGTDGFAERMVARRTSALATGRMEYVGGGTRNALLNAGHAAFRLARRF